MVWGRLGFGRAHKCRLAIPGNLALTKRVKAPAVAGEDLAQVLRFEAGQAVPFSLDKVAWGGVVLRNDGEEMELLISAAKLDAVEPLCVAAESAQLSPTHCEPAALALWRAFSREVAEPSLFVDVGARTTQVIIGGGGVAPYLRTLNFGGNTVTSSLAQTLGCDFAEAEAAKRRASPRAQGGGPQSQSEVLLSEAVQTAANAFAQKLGSELLLTKLAYLRQSGALSPTRFYLCGGGSSLSGLREKLTETLSLPVFELPPPSGMEVAASLEGGREVSTSDLYTLYGLALGAALPETKVINLLPLGRRAARGARVRRRWHLAAAALLVFLPLPLLFQQCSAIAALRAEAASVDSAAAPFLRFSESNVQAQAEVSALRARLAHLDELNAQRESWLGFFADLQARLNEVGDVWLERLHYNLPRSNHDSEAASPPVATIEIGGWLLEGPRADEAIQRLFDALQASDCVQGISRERYDRNRPGVIRFDATILIAPEKLL